MPGRVRTRRQFALLSAATGRGQSGPLRISFVATPGEVGVDVAYAISRKVGNAVVRNRTRRRLRMAMDDLRPPPRPGLYLVKCGIQTGNLSYAQLLLHLSKAVERANDA